MPKEATTSLEAELKQAMTDAASPPEDGNQTVTPPAADAPAATTPVETLPPAETPPAETPPPTDAPQNGAPVDPNAGLPELVRRKWEAAEPEQAPPDADAKTDLLTRLKSEYSTDLGDKYADDDALIRGLLNASSMVGRRDEDAAAWKQFSENPEQHLQQWGYIKQQQQAQQAQQQPAPQQQQPTGGPPEFDENWYQQVQTDPATGEVTGVKPGYDPSIPGKLRVAEQWAKQAQQKLLFNPEEILQPIIDKKVDAIREEMERKVTEQVANTTVQQEAWNWINSDQNRSWIFKNGNPQAGLSDQGAKFQQYVQEAQSDGVPSSDLNRLVQKATEKMELDWYRSQQPRQKQAPAPTTAMGGTSVAPQGEGRDLGIQDGESLNTALRRITGI